MWVDEIAIPNSPNAKKLVTLAMDPSAKARRHTREAIPSTHKLRAPPLKHPNQPTMPSDDYYTTREGGKFAKIAIPL